MHNLNLNPIVYRKGKMAKKKRGKWRTEVMAVGQTISLEGNVIYCFKIKERLEGLCGIRYKIHEAKNLKGNFACYEVQRNAKGAPVLVRVS